jgi:hypothetical protein
MKLVNLLQGMITKNKIKTDASDYGHDWHIPSKRNSNRPTDPQ